MRATFQGSIVALVTPFRGGKVDEAKLRELVEWHVASGTDGIVPRSEEHTSELQSLRHLVCRLLLEKKKKLMLRKVDGTTIESSSVHAKVNHSAVVIVVAGCV